MNGMTKRDWRKLLRQYRLLRTIGTVNRLSAAVKKITAAGAAALLTFDLIGAVRTRLHRRRSL